MVEYMQLKLDIHKLDLLTQHFQDAVLLTSPTFFVFDCHVDKMCVFTYESRIVLDTD